MHDFESLLSGGHHNSLGHTIEVVELVLADRKLLANLLDCYRSSDELVRLRVSNALKRVTIAQPTWVADYIEDLLSWIADIDQPSTQWTLAIVFDLLRGQMGREQFARATGIVKRNLADHDDWIVLNNSMKTLTKWSAHVDGLAEWMLPHLHRLASDTRKSVAANARKSLKSLNAQSLMPG